MVSTFGIGYRYLAGINQAPENRIELDATPQFPLPWRIQAGDRSRIDLRFIEGNGFSWRYRNRLNVQRTFRIHRFLAHPTRSGRTMSTTTTLGPFPIMSMLLG